MLSEKHKALLDRWVESLKQIPAVDVIWLDGSLTDDKRANPGSDLDIRFGIRDDAYKQLWGEDPTPLLEGMGEYFPLVWPWRLLTAVEGIVIEIMALRTSELEGKEFYEWVILFSRLPDGKPVFHKIPQKPASDTWPEKEKLTVEKLRSLSCIYLNELSRIPGSFYNGEILSAWASHDWIREELLKIFYMRSSVQFSARSKHFSEVLHPDFLSDLGSTYRYLGESALTPATAASAILHIIWTIG